MTVTTACHYHRRRRRRRAAFCLHIVEHICLAAGCQMVLNLLVEEKGKRGRQIERRDLLLPLSLSRVYDINITTAHFALFIIQAFPCHIFDPEQIQLDTSRPKGAGTKATLTYYAH